MNMRSVWFSLYISRRKKLIDLVLDPGEMLLICELNSQSNYTHPSRAPGAHDWLEWFMARSEPLRFPFTEPGPSMDCVFFLNTNTEWTAIVEFEKKNV